MLQSYVRLRAAPYGAGSRVKKKNPVSPIRSFLPHYLSFLIFHVISKQDRERLTGAVRQCLEDGVVVWICDDVVLDEGSAQDRVSVVAVRQLHDTVTQQTMSSLDVIVSSLRL